MIKPACKACKDCTFWDAKVGKMFGAVHLCNRATEIWNATEWYEDLEDEDEARGKEIENYEDVGRRFLPECKDVGMFTQDGSSYKASLFTRPDFYCADFKQKEEEDATNR